MCCFHVVTKDLKKTKKGEDRFYFICETVTLKMINGAEHGTIAY